jgi:hypothetical protein
MSLTRRLDCLYCLDGNVPAGVHPFIGPAYQACQHCLYICDLCEGDGLFPSDFVCITCFTARLAAIGLAAILCGHCSGVVELIPTNITSEVTCHEHH